MGRRWGKTVLGGVLTLLCASQGGRAAWVVPTYKNGRPMWRWAQATAAPLKRHGVEINRAERTIEFPNGGGFGVYSADSEDSIRGEAFHLVIIDEAARVSETAFTDAILPTVADTGGDLILISTPRGKNWFFREYARGQGDGREYASWTAPTSANPNPFIRRAFEMARERVSERSFREEWLAEFLDDGGDVFRGVRAAATGLALEHGEAGQRYVFGVDLGKQHDFTVIAVFDPERRAMVALDRFSKIDYTLQLGRLTALAERFPPQTVVIERNIGEMFIEQAQRAGLPVLPFQTTASSKQRIIDDLALAFERQEITILDDGALVSELEAYAMERLMSGAFRYSAPEGLHDDTVIATALAWHAINRPVFRFGL